MAKKDEHNVNGSVRVKFRYADTDRYFDLDVDGIKNEAGVVDGLKSIANALAGRTLATTAPKPALVAKSNPGGVVVLSATPTEAEVQNADERGAENDIVETDTTNGNGVPKLRKKYAPKAPTFLSALDLSKATFALQDFVATKNTTEMMDKYTVVATWFKEQMGLEEITADHIFTVFRVMSWQIPDDPVQPLRDLKSKKQFFDKGESVGGYKITFLGTNYVSKMGSKQ